MMESEEQTEKQVESVVQKISDVFKICEQFLKKIDRQIVLNFKKSKIEPRTRKGNGLWCCILLPSILCLYTFLYAVTPLYAQVACLSLGLLCYSLLFSLFISMSCVVLDEPKFSGCMASSMLSSLLLYTFCRVGLAPAVTVSFLSVYTYAISLRTCLLKFPRTFTVGELTIILQGTVLFYIYSISRIFSELFNPTNTSIFIESIVVTVLTTGILVFVALVRLVPANERNSYHLMSFLTVGLGFDTMLLHFLLGPTVVYDVIVYIFDDTNRIKLTIFWLALICAAAMIVVSRTSWSLKAGSATRKAFHVLASLVFASGVLVDVDYMKLAAGLGLAALLSVEALRKCGVEPFSSALQSAFDIYKDEKDCGVFAVTPIYMYVGLACPLVLVPGHRGAALERLAGVLATGVGDTAASWFGERYGQIKWTGSNRTFEGTFFNVLSQVTAVYVLELFEVLDVNFALTRTFVAATAVGFVEAKTEQVDNLVLPLVMLIMFQLTFLVA